MKKEEDQEKDDCQSLVGYSVPVCGGQELLRPGGLQGLII